MNQSSNKASRFAVTRGIKIALPILIFAVCVTLLWQKIVAMDISAIKNALVAVELKSCSIAALATWLSLRAVGQYDAIWHQTLRTGIAPHVAARAGMTAVAIAQTLGFGAITASLVRLRSLPQMSLWKVTQLSAAVSLTFMACWALYALVAVWWLGATMKLSPIWVILIALTSIIMLGAVAFGRDRFKGALTTTRLFQLMGWTGFDMLCASAALYVLLPAGTETQFTMLFAAYIIALGAGLLSSSPGGAGAFDLTLLTLLSGQEEMVASLIIFRVIYYVIPAAIAFIAIMSRKTPTTSDIKGPAFWGLAYQTGDLRHIAGRDWFIGRLPFFHCSIGAHDQQHSEPVDVQKIGRVARRRGRCGVFYNCSPRLAAAADRAGWYVRRIAMEAVVRPNNWTLEGRGFQTLRRKLRRAQLAGVHIQQANDAHTMPVLAKIARNWAIQHGGEMGFSMGRFSTDLIAKQRVFLIKNDCETIGFVTFCISHDNWHLDLIRHQGRLPDGAMHAAIVAAIDAAAAENVTLVSLATVPDPRHTPSYWSERKRGLIQFKRSFSPVWLPRYHAAPNKLMFWISGLVIAVAIHRPLQNLPWKALRLIKIAALELKLSPRHDKRLVKQNGSPERS
ncbi:phosphatidylglycerol lysyltransferase [Yoonia maritima]|uniref:Phosphatidylglycerol lysyltransferase n=2 Tax=Yoonia maritima TaxID=1435347 RepID=A0A2T0W179_9RHOB|nr:phosphatidylglycerol lysyltransferase [Yoonia maritima]